MAQYHSHYSVMQGVIDSIAHEQHPEQRLAYLHRLRADADRMILAHRDEAAYDLRTRFNGEDSERVTGIPRRYIDYWAQRHRRKHNLPALKRISKSDISGAFDLRHLS